MAGERLFSSVYSHVPTEVGGSDETMVTHLAEKWSFWLLLLFILRLGGLDNLLLGLDKIGLY